MLRGKTARSRLLKVTSLSVALVLILGHLTFPISSVKAVEQEALQKKEQYVPEQGFSSVQTPAFITANGRTVAVLHRVWSSKLNAYGTWELAEMCPYSRSKLGQGNEGLTYSVSEAYFGIRYSKNDVSYFEWSNDFPNIDHADYELGTPIVKINMSAPTQPDVRLTWVFFASEENDCIVWGAYVTNLAGETLNDVAIYFNFEAPINNERCNFVWHQNESAYVVEKPNLGIYVAVSSWKPPLAHYAGSGTKYRIYADALENTTGNVYAESCGFKWSVGTLSPEESSKAFFLTIALGDTSEEAISKIHDATQKSPSQHYDTTKAFWRDWLGKASLETPDPYLNQMFTLSLMFALMGIHRPSGAVMACMDGTRWMRWGGEVQDSRWMFRPYYLHIWVRDLVFFSVIFDLLGYVDEAQNALNFAKSVQNPEGSFYTFYEVDGHVSNTWPNETDQTALYVYGVYFHYCATGDTAFLDETWDSVLKACSYLQRMQNYSGLVYTQASIHEWPGVSQGYEPWTQTCSYAALETGSRIAEILGHLSKASEWENAAEKVRSETITNLWNSTINSFCQRLYNGKQYTWADIKMLTPFLFYTPLLNASESKLQLTYEYLLRNLNDTTIGGIWRYQKDAGDPMVPERWNGGYGPWFTYTCWFALYKLANGENDEAFKWIEWCKSHATAQGFFAEHIATYQWDYLYQDSAKATRSYYGIGTFGGWIAYTLASTFIKIADQSGLTICPHLPSYWDSMNLTFTYRGTKFTVKIRGQGEIGKITVDGKEVQSLRIPSRYYDRGLHTILVNSTSTLSAPYVEDSPLLNIQDSTYDNASDTLNLEINAPYLLESTIHVTSPEEPVVVYVNDVPCARSYSLTGLLSHDAGWLYNSTEARLYIKVKASLNPVKVSSIFSYSLIVKAVDHYGNALPGSVVTISWPNGTIIQAQNTNGDGYAHLCHLSKRSYNIRVEHKGVVYESPVDLETAATSLTARLEIIGFVFGAPVTEVEANVALILMAAIMVVCMPRRIRTPLTRRLRGLEDRIKGRGEAG